MQARSIETCLDADGHIARLTAHAGRLLKLQRIFEQATPAALRHQGRVANLRLGKVIIHAANGAVAAKLKQLAPRLLDLFLIEVPQATEVQVKVQPGVPDSAAPRKVAPAHISDHGKESLTSLANRLPEESPLRSALGRLLEKAK